MAHKRPVGYGNNEWAYPCDLCGIDTENIDEDLDIICDECKKPKPGWHYIRCMKCQTNIGEMRHYGGEEEIKVCAYCDKGWRMCQDCFNKDIRL